MAGNEITVNAAILRKYADDIGTCHTTYRTCLYNSKGRIDSLKGVWTGSAAEAFGLSFQQLLDRCSEGLDTLSRMVNALYDSADSYERGEKAVQSGAAGQPKLPENTMR